MIAPQQHLFDGNLSTKNAFFVRIEKLAKLREKNDAILQQANRYFFGEFFQLKTRQFVGNARRQRFFTRTSRQSRSNTTKKQTRYASSAGQQAHIQHYYVSARGSAAVRVYARAKPSSHVKRALSKSPKFAEFSALEFAALRARFSSRALSITAILMLGGLGALSRALCIISNIELDLKKKKTVG